jgi:hypothetical protein
MAEIIPFRIPPPRQPTQEELLNQVLTGKQAVDLLILGMLDVVLPRWIEAQWGFQQLEIMCDELRDAMSVNVPSGVTRFQVEAMVNHLRPSWQELANNIGPELFD